MPIIIFIITTKNTKTVYMFSLQTLSAVGTVGAIGAGAVAGAMLQQENDEQAASISNNAASILSNQESLQGSSMQY